MFLRSLTLKGFKSFAEKTTLEFAPGISVIVGPNGSGKSNLVDAISWVLGEQGPRALRGGQMADVIFAGSPKRAALGMAEVKLVIDNEAGKIPVPMSELEIGRAVYRAGDAEYRMGGQQCRLLDIQELLSDSGIGRALHTVVGQGQLDDVLTARPEERRQFIEEAAGIAKHRRRKERAQRKLGSLEQDLLRLQDVLAELKRQLRPLKQQAEVARRHEKLSSEAEEISWRLAAARLRSLLDAQEVKRPVWERGVELRTTGKRRLEELDLEIERLAREHERTTAGFTEAEAALREAQAGLAACDATLREAAANEAAARSKIASEAARTLRLGTLKEEMTALGSEAHQIASDIELRERELDEAEAAFRRAESLRREAEEERRRLSEEAAAHRAEMETLRRQLAAHERERARLEEHLKAAEVRVAVFEAEQGSTAETLERLTGERRPLEEILGALEGDRHRIASEVAELEDSLRRYMAKRDLAQMRRSDIEETAGSRFIQTNPGRAIGLLRGLVSAPGAEEALSAALGPYADAVVYERVDTAVEDAAEAHGTTLAGGDVSPPEHSLPSERPLMDVVEVDPRAAGLAAAVLADTYLVPDKASAAALSRANPGCRFVTRDGLMIGRGLVQSAASDVRARALMEDLTRIERDIAAANEALSPARERLAGVFAEIASANAGVQAIDPQMAAAKERLVQVGSELGPARREVDMIGQRLSGMDEAAGSWRDALALVPQPVAEAASLPPQAEAPIGARVAVETLRRERLSVDARLERARAAYEEITAETPDQLRAAAQDAEDRFKAAEASHRAATDAQAALLLRRDASAAADRDAVAAETDANKQWREAAAELDRLREAYEHEDRDRGEVERRIAEAERLLREGYSKDPAEALAALTDSDSAADLERRSEVVQRRLGLLGKVNLLATGEFEVIQERHDFMVRELEDVRRARRDLLEVVKRVDDEVIALFDAAYRDVATTFEQMFKDLFPGGEGRLILTDPANLLETGVDVEARPGRKRVKRLSLLSGGERALTALCFLFSIFRSRPSPFYLLDEVEAALDDVNLHRFLGLIKGFAQDSQVLIVTHQKRTMEVADMLYGVSMSQDGSSRVVCQTLDHGEALHIEPLVSNADSVI